MHDTDADGKHGAKPAPTYWQLIEIALAAKDHLAMTDGPLREVTDAESIDGRLRNALDEVGL